MRFASLLLLSAVASTGCAAVASATTFYSNSSSTSYLGYSATSTAPHLGPAASTYDIGTGGVWSAPVAGSSWISYDPNTEPGGTHSTPMHHAPNGYYTYATTFLAGTGATGFLTLMADDTVSVFLDGSEILTGAPGPYPKCAVMTPNCTTPLTIALTGIEAGINNLDFVVHQANDYATGLDFAGSVTATPEPNSLLLLGTGLVGTAGALLRRFRRA